MNHSNILLLLTLFSGALLTTSCGDVADTTDGTTEDLKDLPSSTSSSEKKKSHNNRRQIRKKKYVLAFNNKEDKDQGVKLLALLKGKCQLGKVYRSLFSNQAKNDNHTFGNAISSLYNQLKEKNVFEAELTGDVLQDFKYLKALENINKIEGKTAKKLFPLLQNLLDACNDVSHYNPVDILKKICRSAGISEKEIQETATSTSA